MSTMSNKRDVQAYWQAFVQENPGVTDREFLESFHFDESEAIANELLELVLVGRKRATASLLWAVEADGKSPPKVGSYSIATDWAGNPRCVLRTTKVDIVPFVEVPGSFAAAEGEGDCSIEYWRKVHLEYFSRLCARIGKNPSDTMPVVCEEFEVVHIDA